MTQDIEKRHIVTLSNLLIISWLERGDVKITLGRDGTECDVQEIRELLDSGDDSPSGEQ